MSALPWLRLYREIIDDPKTGTLKDSEFRLYIEILCLISEKNDGISQKFLSWRVRRDTKKHLAELINRGLILDVLMDNGERLLFVNGWEKRQFTSDSSNERTKRYRDKLKKCDGNETSQSPSQERHSDATDKIRTEEIREEKNNTSTSSPLVHEIFDFWKVSTGHEKAVLDDKRKSKITKALKGYSVEQIKKAIGGYVNSAWHKENRQDEITLMLRDSAHIERFLVPVTSGNDLRSKFGYVDPT